MKAPDPHDIFHRTWEEVCKLAEHNYPLNTIQGGLISGPGRQFDPARDFYPYANSVLIACERYPEHVPEHIKLENQKRLDSFHAGNKRAFREPLVAGVNMLNAKGRPFTWSFSALNDFETCACQYAAKRFFCTVEDTANEANLFGGRVHKGAEDHLKDGTPMEGELAAYAKYPYLVRKQALANNLIIAPEVQFCINEDMKPVDWYAPDAWGRAIVDALLLSQDKKTAWLYDWKTGKVKPDSRQLKDFCAFVSIYYPTVETFIPRFVWMKYDQITGEDVMLSDLPDIWANLLARINRVKAAWETQKFPCKPSGLCKGWCPVKSCEFCR